MRRTGFLALFLLLNYSCKQQETINDPTRTNPAGLASSCSIGKWSNSNFPINLKISSEFAGDFTGDDMVNGLNPLEQMGKVWNDSGAGKTFFNIPFSTAQTTGSTSASAFRDSEMGLYKSHTWFSDVSSRAIAITQYYGFLRSDASLGSYIDLTHADIIFNYRDFGAQFTTASNSIIGYDLSTVALHEMGHFLGMCHDEGHTSIMRPYYISNQRALFSFDRTKIFDLYVNNKNTLSGTSAMSSSNAISLPEGTEVRGRIELISNGLCRHFLNGKLTFEHMTEKKGLVKNKAFNKIFSKFNKLF